MACAAQALSLPFGPITDAPSGGASVSRSLKAPHAIEQKEARK